MMTPKPDMTLLPPDALLAMADVMTRANTPEKHQDAKWKRMTPEEHIAAALRHTFAWLGGEKVDPELGTSHLANASVRMSMALSLALAPLAHSTTLRSPLRADALRDPLRGSAPATTDTSYKTQHWWVHQDEVGWEGNQDDTDIPETRFKVGDRVVHRLTPIDRGTVVDVRGRTVVVKWDKSDIYPNDPLHEHPAINLRHAPTKTLDDFTPDQWDTAADRSKDIWAETKV